MNVKKARKILNKKSDTQTDNQVQDAIHQPEVLADLIIDKFLEKYKKGSIKSVKKYSNTTDKIGVQNKLVDPQAKIQSR